MNTDQQGWPIALVLICVHLCSSAVSFAEPVRGVSLAHATRGNGYGTESCREQIERIRSIGGNWISVTGFAYMPGVNSPRVGFGGRMSEDVGIPRTIRDAHAAGLKVLIKPHIWAGDFGRGGKWAADVKMESEADWDAWFAAYTEYVLFNARIAADNGADALCVGCELQGTSAQTERWRKLIAEVRKIYQGPLTYAATWGEWQQIAFWGELDCIGIDAYFPVTDKELADDAEIRAGWARVFDQLEVFSKKWNRNICLTEIGYTPSARAGVEPWSGTVVNPSPEYQSRLYRIALEEAASRDYVVGAFVWKWFTTQGGGRDAFAIQNRQHIIDELRKAWRLPRQ